MFSGLSKLTHVEVPNNPINSINTTGCSKLKSLHIEYNNLSSIDLSTNGDLSTFDCAFNNISTLNLFDNKKLKLLTFTGNGTSSINLIQCSKLEILQGPSNNLTDIDLSGCPLLQRIILSSNLLTSLDVSNQPDLFFLRIHTNSIGELNLDNNGNLNKVWAWDCNFTVLSVQNGNNTSIAEFRIEHNPLLFCCAVDDAAYSTANWTSKDVQTLYNSVFCGAPFFPTTQLTTAFCNQQLTTFGEYFYINNISADEYRYQFTNITTPSSPQSFYRTQHFATLSSLFLFGLNQTYEVQIAYRIGTTWYPFGPECQLTSPSSIPLTQIITADCNTTMGTFDEFFFCDAVSGTIDLPAYRFQFTDPVTNLVVTTKDRNNNSITLQAASLLTPGAVYEVRCAAKVGGVWGAYGLPCNITAPNALSTQITAADCNTTMGTFEQFFFCDAVAGATDYRYQFEDVTPGGGPLLITKWNVRTGTLNNSLVAATLHNIGRTWSVKVQALVGGVWQSYGPACEISSPATVELTQLTPASCGAIMPLFNSFFGCNEVSGGQGYRYEWTDLVTGFMGEQTRTGGNADINNFTAASGAIDPSLLTLGETYSVRVKARVGTTWGDYSTPCLITLSSAAMILINDGEMSETTGNEFKSAGEDEITVTEKLNDTETAVYNISIFPNPAKEWVTIQLSEKEEETVKVAIYNVQGQLVKQESFLGSVKQVSLTDLNAGLYLLKISTGDQLVAKRLIIE